MLAEGARIDAHQVVDLIESLEKQMIAGARHHKGATPKCTAKIPAMTTP
jgi:hypothetical protein